MAKMERAEGGYLFPEVGLFAYVEETTNPHRWVLVPDGQEGPAMFATRLSDIRQMVDCIQAARESARVVA